VYRDLPALIDMVSAGTLMAFAVVAMALIWKRYTDVGQQRRKSWKALVLLGMITLSCIGEFGGSG
jgi:amino acid transporter